jgi:predicted glutamine amidotransferase
MCRFLLAASDTLFEARTLLHPFAELAERSTTRDGEFQGDGWGYGWRDDGQWHIRKSLAPVWTERAVFATTPSTQSFIAHARAASFDLHKDDVQFNQPFVSADGRWVFVFNGLLRGVKLPYKVPGVIGAQKIWNLLQQLLIDAAPQEALTHLRDLLRAHAQRVQACNIGLSDGTRLHALTLFDERPTYYQLLAGRCDGVNVIASAPLDGFIMQPLPMGEVVSI